MYLYLLYTTAKPTKTARALSRPQQQTPAVRPSSRCSLDFMSQMGPGGLMGQHCSTHAPSASPAPYPACLHGCLTHRRRRVCVLNGRTGRLCSFYWHSIPLGTCRRTEWRRPREQPCWAPQAQDPSHRGVQPHGEPFLSFPFLFPFLFPAPESPRFQPSRRPASW